ncbi:hypothetical protein FQN51_005648 [Onygenales sp. PD_10]|nr:hypothetical protein FQN51_005648 [Onygenales sp. PD_10]
MRTQYPSIPSETSQVYGTPPFEQSSPFAHTDIYPSSFDPSPCSIPNSNVNDLMMSGSYLTQSAESVPRGFPPQDLWTHGLNEAFLSNSYLDRTDARNDMLWAGDDSTTTLFPQGSSFSQEHSPVDLRAFNYSTSFSEYQSIHGANLSPPLDDMRVQQRQRLSLPNYLDPSIQRLGSNSPTVFPPSPAHSVVSSPSGESNHPQFTPDPTPYSSANIMSGDETDGGKDHDDLPYAKLIYRALMSAPGKKMVLKEIYEWFEKNTSKARNADSKGWQNSIRHNLSMNAAFQGMKDDSSPEGGPRKVANVWVLTEDAIRKGVQSTTRYRKPGIHKKSSKSEHPAPQRQRSGAKGGKAAKKAAKLKRELQGPQKGTVDPETTFPLYHLGNNNNLTIPNGDYQHIYSDQLMSDGYGLRNVIGLADHPSPIYPDPDMHGSRLLSESLFSATNRAGPRI